MTATLDARCALAERVAALDAVPPRVTEAFFERHPAWARFGPAGRGRCTEDGRFHLKFIAAAVQADSAALFADYVGWTASVLLARGLEPAHLLEHVHMLASALEAELSPEDATAVRRLVTPALNAAQARRPTDVPADAREPLRLEYLAAAIAGRRAQALALVRRALDEGWSMGDIYRDLLLAVQHRLGELWASATITVAQEHLASAVTHGVMAALYLDLPSRVPPVGRALVLGVEGELHALPAHFAADLLELAGWEVTCAGTHVPLSAIEAAVHDTAPDVLGFSTTLPANLPRTVAAVRAVRARRPSQRIVLGGRALASAPRLAAELGVEQVAPNEDVGALRPP